MLTGLLIKNIKCLVQTEDIPQLKICGSEMSTISSISDAWLLIVDSLIADFGRMGDFNEDKLLNRHVQYRTIDAAGKFVFPSFCDSHTHLVYSGSREIEYIDKIKGLSYAEIARKGGGILNSVKNFMKLQKVN